MAFNDSFLNFDKLNICFLNLFIFVLPYFFVVPIVFFIILLFTEISIFVCIVNTVALLITITILYAINDGIIKTNGIYSPKSIFKINYKLLKFIHKEDLKCFIKLFLVNIFLLLTNISTLIIFFSMILFFAIYNSYTNIVNIKYEKIYNILKYFFFFIFGISYLLSYFI